MLIAQITDTHIKPEGSLAYGHVDTSAFLARAVDHILHLDPRPDVVLGTGGLVDGDTPAEYPRLRHLLSPLPWARPAGGAGRSDETQGSGARKVVCVSYVPGLRGRPGGRDIAVRPKHPGEAGRTHDERRRILLPEHAHRLTTIADVDEHVRRSIFAPTGGGRRRLSSW